MIRFLRILKYWYHISEIQHRFSYNDIINNDTKYKDDDNDV